MSNMNPVTTHVDIQIRILQFLTAIPIVAISAIILNSHTPSTIRLPSELGTPPPIARASVTVSSFGLVIAIANLLFIYLIRKNPTAPNHRDRITAYRFASVVLDMVYAISFVVMGVNVQSQLRPDHGDNRYSKQSPQCWGDSYLLNSKIVQGPDGFNGNWDDDAKLYSYHRCNMWRGVEYTFYIGLVWGILGFLIPFVYLAQNKKYRSPPYTRARQATATTEKHHRSSDDAETASMQTVVAPHQRPAQA